MDRWLAWVAANSFIFLCTGPWRLGAFVGLFYCDVGSPGWGGGVQQESAGGQDTLVGVNVVGRIKT